jgi:hypothetical protein
MLKRMRLYQIATILIGSIIVNGCGRILDIGYSRAENCRIKINKRFVKNSCGLTNGICFEKLLVLKKDTNGIPIEYYITERFDCLSGQGIWTNKIHFNTVNRHYTWRTDTANHNIHIKIGEYGERQLFDTLGNKNIINHYFRGMDSETCPFSFIKNSWYYFFSKQKNSSRYLFVDDKEHFYLYDR